MKIHSNRRKVFHNEALHSRMKQRKGIRTQGRDKAPGRKSKRS